MKFIVDGMLGKLAKWLKILGFDVIFLNRAADDEILRRARNEKRVLLTRDHQLFAAAGNSRAMLVESEEWPEQLSQVLDAFDLRTAVRPYSRCLTCNVRLRRISRQRARNLVAPFVLEQAPSFAICPGCGRVFWPGTHYDDMSARLREILGKGEVARGRGKRPQGKKGR